MMSIPNGICSFNNNSSRYNFDKVKIATYPRNLYLHISVERLLRAGTWPGLGSDEEQQPMRSHLGKLSLEQGSTNFHEEPDSKSFRLCRPPKSNLRQYVNKRVGSFQ